jgi:hypothetical protein
VYNPADLMRSFNCHAFLDNTTICILEISVKTPALNFVPRSFHWILIHKLDLSVRELSLKARDDSNWVQERFFDMGYLKYNSSEGIFISAPANELHPLQPRDCSHVPEMYLSAVEAWIYQLRDISVLSERGRND